MPEPVAPKDWSAYAEGRDFDRRNLLVEHHRERFQVFVHVFRSIDPRSSVLDVGCGTGFYLETLRQLGFTELRGIDPSEPFRERCRSKGLDVRPGTLAELEPTADRDVLILSEILEHTPDPAGGLRRAAGVLRKGGMAYVTVPVYDSLRSRWERLVKRVSKLEQAVDHDPTHLQALSAGDVERWFREAGLAPTFIKHVHNPLPGPFRFRPLSAALALALPVGDFLVAVGRK